MRFCSMHLADVHMALHCKALMPSGHGHRGVKASGLHAALQKCAAIGTKLAALHDSSVQTYDLTCQEGKLTYLRE